MKAKETDAIDYLRGYQEGEKAGEEMGYVKGFDAAESTMVPRATEDGRKAGISEVVEWLKTCELNRCCDGVTDKVFCRNYRVYDSEWQAKLKEWGTEMSPQ